MSDDPLKAAREPGSSRSDVLAVLAPAMRGAQRSLTLISPYFVPGEKGTAALTQIAQQGAIVRVLTNSLAANDVAAVHGGDAKYRRPLLEGGVTLRELKPLPGMKPSYAMFGSKKASLHTKALAVDGRQLQPRPALHRAQL